MHYVVFKPVTRKMTTILTAFAIVQTLVLLGVLWPTVWYDKRRVDIYEEFKLMQDIF